MIDLLVIMLFMLYALPVLVVITWMSQDSAPVHFPHMDGLLMLYSLVLILLMIYCLGINPSMNSPY